MKTLSPFVKLADPRAYVSCPWELHVDVAARTYWVEFFKRHVSTILDLGVAGAVERGEARDGALRRAEACRVEFVARFDAFAGEPERFGPVTIITLDRWRDDVLRKHGFVDAFLELKNRENAKMLPLLPGVCRHVDSLEGEAKIFSLVTGVFAGNIFDMGAEAVAKQFVGEPEAAAVAV